MSNTKIRYETADGLTDKGQRVMEATNQLLGEFTNCTEKEALEMIAVITQFFCSAKAGYLIAAQIEGDDQDLVFDVAGRFVEAEARAFELTYTDAAEYAGVENLFFEKRTLQ